MASRGRIRYAQSPSRRTRWTTAALIVSVLLSVMTLFGAALSAGAVKP